MGRLTCCVGAAALLGAAGCVDLGGLAGGDDPTSQAPAEGHRDPRSDAPSPSPASPAPAPKTQCSTSTPFAAEELFVSDAARVWGGRVSGSNLYFTRAKQAGETRLVVAPLLNPALTSDVTPQGAAGWLGYPSVTDDGLRMYFSMPRQVNGSPIAGDDDIFVARRARPTDVWESPTRLSASRANLHDVAPFLAASGTTLYFATYTDGVTEAREIRRASVAAGVSDAGEIALVGAPAGQKPTSPVVSADEKTMYFAMNDATSGQRTIYIATRSANDVFSAPKVVGELSKAGREASPTWISADQCVLYFDVSEGDRSRIFRAWRAP